MKHRLLGITADDLFSADTASFFQPRVFHLVAPIGCSSACGLCGAVRKKTQSDYPKRQGAEGVRPESVCANYRQDIRQFSPCTVKASRLFNALCSELGQAESDDWRRVKVRNMYCNAATVAAMGNSDPQVARERDKSCDSYRSMKTGK